MSVMTAEQVVTVGLGEIRASADEKTVLMALGLGSCIGIAFYDPRARVGGMAHVVLPAPPNGAVSDSPKFAPVAVLALLKDVLALGAQKGRLVCTIAGGAQVLASGSLKHNFRIGERNIEAVLAALAKAAIRPKAQDCGGTTGRSFRLTVKDGHTGVKRLGSDWQAL